MTDAIASRVEPGNPMKKWLVVGGVVGLVLLVVIVVLAVQLAGTSSKLADRDAQVTSLKSQLSSVQADLSAAQTQLAQEKSRASGLQTDLQAARSQVDSLNKTVASQQATISQQAAQIQTMKYPHSFSTIDELTTWLQKNNPVTWDPNTLTPIQRAQMALALEVKAARDGYLMPAILPLFGNVDWMTNRTIVGDMVYEIKAWDGGVQIGGRVTPALPPYPITPDSGK